MVSARRQSGQALVEFSLTAIIFIAVLLFLLDGGRILWNWVTLSEAVREGARYAIVHGAYADPMVRQCGTYPVDQIQQEVIDHALGMGTTLRPANITVTCPSNNPYTTVTVQATLPIQPIFMSLWGGGTITIKAESTMEIMT
jgi:hypothetical protein